jgi:signal transduction histidine kinase
MLELPDRLRTVVHASAAIAIVCGASGIVGWAFGIRGLLSVIEGAPGLMPLGAFGLLAAGMALLCAIWRPAYGQLLGVVVASICLLGGVGYLIGHDFGLGDLPAGVIRGAGTLPGLSAPSSIVALGCIGLALVTLPWTPVLAQGAALVALTIAYLGALGELFGASMVQGVSAYTAMSPQTIVATSALALGILCATPGAGVMPLLMDSGVAGLAVRRFLPIAIVLPLVLGGLRVAGEAAGFFDTRFGTALMTVASAALAGILTIDIAIAIRDLDQRLGREHSARAIAESESRIKDDVLSLLTQELRTPANVIHAQAHLLQSGVVTQERTRQAIEAVSVNAARLRKYVDDAVEVASLAQGGVLLQLVEVDPRDAVRAALETWTPRIADKGITLTTQLTPAGVVLGDASRIERIASNLLSNAVKFTPGGGAIHVETSRDGEFVRLVVADTGVGIAPDFLPFVFEPFRRSGALVDGHVEGLGLGLAIVRHLVELHGGSVSAASDGEGRGALFTVRLRGVAGA